MDRSRVVATETPQTPYPSIEPGDGLDTGDMEPPTTVSFDASDTVLRGHLIQEYEWTLSHLDAETGEPVDEYHRKTTDDPHVSLTVQAASSGQAPFQRVSLTVTDEADNSGTVERDFLVGSLDAGQLDVSSDVVQGESRNLVTVDVEIPASGVAVERLLWTVESRDGVSGGPDSFVEAAGTVGGRSTESDTDSSDISFPVTDEGTVTIALVAWDSLGRQFSTRVDVHVPAETVDPVDGTQPVSVDSDPQRESLNGDDEVDFDDVVTLFQNMDDPAITDNAWAYDYSGNGEVDYQDVVTLFESV